MKNLLNRNQGISMNVIEGVVSAPKARVAIAIARFNNFINDSLLDGAVDALKRIGQVSEENITVVWVPGAYELPLAARTLAETGRYDAIVALGTVIRGGTAHFEYVAGGASSGLAQVAMESQIPVTFGVLTTENIEQAIERAGTKAGNKGAEAAMTALEMINVINAIKA
jgi:6,7-dimethyl-8-ribityllumazine synthase